MSIQAPAGGLLAALAVGAMPAFALAGDGPIWTHASGAENWIGKVVSVGNEGTQVFAALGVLQSRTRLFSAHDANPPTPIWEDALPHYTYDHSVDSANRADVHAYLHYENPQLFGNNLPVLRRYASTHSGPVWSWSFPFEVGHPNGGVHVSDDGEHVIGWVFNASAGKTAVAAFTGDSNNPVSYSTLHTYGEPKGVRMSADGSLLYISSGIKTILMNPLSGDVVHEHINWEGVGNGHAFAADGSVFAQVVPPSRVKVYARQGNDYEELFTYQHPAATICNNLDLSADGSLLAGAFDHYNGWLQVDIVALDLSRAGQPVVLTDTTVGAGTYSNVASDISVAADGSAFVVGLWGDELGQAPEVRVYTLGPTGWRLREVHDLPGSVNDVDMGPDGQRFAVASKGIHANQLGGTGRIDFYAVGRPDLELAGVPTSGASVSFLHHTQRGARGLVLYSPLLADAPMHYPGVGSLYLDRTQLHFLPVGTADSNGTIETAFAIASDPTLIGSSLYFQAAGLSPRSFSDNWIKLTILP